MRQLPLLRTLEIAENPFMEDEELQVRTEVLLLHWRLTSIDAVEVKPEEIEEAKELNVKRLLEERARKKEEEENAAGDGDG